MNDLGAESAVHPLARLIARHVRVGWSALGVFVMFGLGLDALHAFKAPLYLDVGNETRRLMWTLAHAHGVGLGLLNIGLAATVHAWLRAPTRALALASALLAWSTVLVPAGFLLGGAVTYEGDPGPLVLLVPIGGGMLLLAVALVVREVFAARAGGEGG